MEDITPAHPKTLDEQALDSLSEDRTFRALDTVKMGVLRALINSDEFQRSTLELTHRALIALSTVKAVTAKPNSHEALRECLIKFRNSVGVALRFGNNGSKD